MRARLPAAGLRDASPALGAAATLSLFVAWATDRAGFPVTHWAPGALLPLAALVLSVILFPPRWPRVPMGVRIALGGLASYTALSYLSILWAPDRGAAFEGADRTLMYAIVFGLFALWPRRSTVTALLVAGWVAAMTGLALFVLVHIDAARQLVGPFGDDRLIYPAGYPNAAAATWLMALWPALLLAASSRVPWWARGGLGAAAVVLGGLALLSLSRGAFYASAVMLILVFAVLPGRVRLFVTLVPVAAGLGASVPSLLLVGHRLLHGGDARSALHAAVVVLVVAALLAGALVAVLALAEGRLPGPARERVGAVARVAAVLCLVGVVAAALVAARGDPVARARDAWHSFKGGYGHSAAASRLISGLGSNRYDFYRVALDEFTSHPLLGIGADNFAAQYLRHGRSSETPHYPHSVEMRTLVQTGAVGVVVLVGALGSALLVGLRRARAGPPSGPALLAEFRRTRGVPTSTPALLAALRRARGEADLGRVATAAALSGFAYWLVHGSFDWFWEFAGLGAPAFALLGLACSEGRPAARHPAGAAPPRPSALGLAAVGAGLLAALALTLPWLSERQVQRAVAIWPRNPGDALSVLHQAASLDPLTDEPYLVAGTIDLRLNDLAGAQREFTRALSRNHDGAYAALELGAIASARGRRSAAVSLLGRARELDPRDELVTQALRTARRGIKVDITALNQSILHKGAQLGR